MQAFSHISYPDGPLRSQWDSLRGLVQRGCFEEALELLDGIATAPGDAAADDDRALFCSLGCEAILLAIQEVENLGSISRSRSDRLQTSVHRRLTEAKPQPAKSSRSAESIIRDIILLGSKPYVMQATQYVARSPTIAERIDRQVMAELHALHEELRTLSLTSRDKFDVGAALKLLRVRVKELPQTTYLLDACCGSWSSIAAAPSVRLRRIPERLSKAMALANPKAVEQPRPELPFRPPKPPDPPRRAAVDPMIEHRRAQRDAWWSALKELSAAWRPTIPGTPITDAEEQTMHRLVLQGLSLPLNSTGGAALRAMQKRGTLLAHDVRLTVLHAVDRTAPQPPTSTS